MQKLVCSATVTGGQKVMGRFSTVKPTSKLQQHSMLYIHIYIHIYIYIYVYIHIYIHYVLFP